MRRIRWISISVCTVAFLLSTCINAYAGSIYILDVDEWELEWKQGSWMKHNGRWTWECTNYDYVPGGGSFWIDGNDDGVAEYYTFKDAYLLAACITEKGLTVDTNGAWTVNGTVVSKKIYDDPNNTSTSFPDLNKGWYIKEGDTGKYVNMRGQNGIYINIGVGTQLYGVNAFGEQISTITDDDGLRASVWMQYRARNELGEYIHNCTTAYSIMPDIERTGDTIQFCNPVDDPSGRNYYQQGNLLIKVLNNTQIEVISAQIKEITSEEYVDPAMVVGVYTFDPDFQLDL